MTVVACDLASVYPTPPQVSLSGLRRRDSSWIGRVLSPYPVSHIFERQVLH